MFLARWRLHILQILRVAQNEDQKYCWVAWKFLTPSCMKVTEFSLARRPIVVIAAQQLRLFNSKVIFFKGPGFPIVRTLGDSPLVREGLPLLERVSNLAAK